MFHHISKVPCKRIFIGAYFQVQWRNWHRKSTDFIKPQQGESLSVGLPGPLLDTKFTLIKATVPLEWNRTYSTIKKINFLNCFLRVLNKNSKISDFHC